MAKQSTAEYRVSAREYLLRARQRLAESRLESLFYAALELRCGVEKRLKEYAEAREDISTRVKRGYRLPPLVKSLDPEGAWGDKVLKAEVHIRSKPSTKHSFFYTPVRSKLQTIAQRYLGELCHSRSEFRPSSDPWWSEIRKVLLTATDELEFSCRGRLLGVPLLDEVHRQIYMKTEAPRSPGDKGDRLIQRIQSGERLVSLQVDYLDDYPE